MGFKLNNFTQDVIVRVLLFLLLKILTTMYSEDTLLSIGIKLMPGNKITLAFYSHLLKSRNILFNKLKTKLFIVIMIVDLLMVMVIIFILVIIVIQIQIVLHILIMLIKYQLIRKPINLN
jgi:hypothetical protein